MRRDRCLVRAHVSATRQVYLVENTNGKRRDRYAMKVLNTKRAFKMAEKATDSNLLGAIQQPLRPPCSWR